MKRMLAMIMVCTMLSCGTAFAAERPTAFSVNGKEAELQHELWTKDGRTLMAVEDFAACTKAQMKETTDDFYLKKERDTWDEDTVRLDTDFDVWVEKRSAWRGSLQGEQSRDGVWYLPLRAAADKFHYTMQWNRTADGDSISMNDPVMPDLSAEVEYDAKTNQAKVTLKNGEPQQFEFGYDFDLQKWNGEAWEDMPLVRDKCIDDIAFILRGDWRGGERTMDYSMRWYGDKLDKGTYRICLPISCTLRDEFDIAKPQNSDAYTETDAKVLTQWELYYGRPESVTDFYVHEVSAGQRSRTEYVVSGSFTAE